MTAPEDEARKPPGGRLWRYAPLALVAIGFVVAITLSPHGALSFDTLKMQRGELAAMVAEHPVLAAGAFVGAYFVFTLLMIPGALWLTIGAGFLFGLAGGSALTVLGATLGATALFLVARTALGAPLRKRAGPFLKRLETGFAENPFSYMLTLRFLPVVPFPVANIAPALLGANLRDFVVATALGIIPGTVAYAWIGSGLGAAFDSGQEPNLAGFARQLFPAFLALAAVSLAPALVKRFRTRKAA